MRKYFLAFLFFLTASIQAFAVDGNYVPPETPQTVNDIFYSFAFGNMQGLIPTLIAVALIVFLSGVIKYIGAGGFIGGGGDNEKKRQSGRDMMIYGIIVLFVMVAFWGLTDILMQSFFPGQQVKIPKYIPLN